MPWLKAASEGHVGLAGQTGLTQAGCPTLEFGIDWIDRVHGPRTRRTFAEGADSARLAAGGQGGLGFTGPPGTGGRRELQKAQGSASTAIATGRT